MLATVERGAVGVAGRSLPPMVVNLTPTGMLPTKAMTPHVPISPAEIVDDVLRCAEIGITVVHLHARDDDGKPTWHPEKYAEIIGPLRRHAPELVICVSLSGRDFVEFEQRSAVLDLFGEFQPNMGSLTLSSLNFPRQASINAPDMVVRLAERMVERGIVPELEAFDLGMVNYAKYLAARGTIRPPFYANLFLGNIAGAQLDLGHAGLLVAGLPEKCLWSFAGIGDAQLPANMLAAAMGGGVRVGLEDTIYYDRERTCLASNVALVRRVHRIAEEAGRPVMSSSEFRGIMGMAPRS